MRSRVALLALAATGVFTPLAFAGGVTAIFCNITGLPTNGVPTIGGDFALGTTSSSAFDRPFLSPDGTRWIIGAIQEAGTDDKDIVIIGGGQTSAGSSTVAVEDSPTSFDPSRTYDSIRTGMGITNSGRYVFGANISGTTTDDELLVLFNGATQTVPIREGQVSPIAGQNFGATIDSAHILNDETPRYHAVMTPTTTKQMLGSGASIISESAVTIPGSQLVAPAQSIGSFTVEQFGSSADGSHHIYSASLAGPTTSNNIFVVDGNVVVQEGANLPGGVLAGTNVGTISVTSTDRLGVMSPSGGHWAARFSMNDGVGAANQTDVVLRDGQVAAKTDSPLFTGSGDLWDDTPFSTTFFLQTINDNGEMVIGGLTNVGNVDKDAKLVYLAPDGTGFVLATEGDPIDLDGNGLYDDNAYIDVFGNDDGVLSNDGHFYFVAAIQNDQNVSIGNAFLTIAVPEPGSSLALLSAAALAGVRRRRRV